MAGYNNMPPLFGADQNPPPCGMGDWMNRMGPGDLNAPSYQTPSMNLAIQPMEDQSPSRWDPNVNSCEDRCLAALQIAIVECLKMVRQRRTGGPGPGNQQAIGYPQQQQLALPPAPPPSIVSYSAPGGGGYPPQNMSGYPPPNDAGYQPASQCRRCSQDRTGGYQQQQSGFAPNAGYLPVAPSMAYSTQQLPPPPTTDITGPPEMIGGPLWQRLASIPEPPPCPRVIPEPSRATQPMNVCQLGPAQQSGPRPRPIGSLAERLAAIPEPRPAECAQAQAQAASQASTQPPRPPPQPSCGIRRTEHSHDREKERAEQAVFYAPVAGSWSDGIGGHKIKSFPTSETGSKRSKGGNLDGVGGRKPKPIEED